MEEQQGHPIHSCGKLNNMDSFSPVVITSRTATNDLNKIKAQHADIVRSMEDHATKVQMFNDTQSANKQMKLQQDTQNQMQSDQQRMDADAKMVDAQNKQRELDIKQQALSL